MDDEELLSGGNVAASVRRVGHLVLKPATAASPAIHALLEHFHACGVAEVPRSFGVDVEGFHAFEFIPGTIAENMPPLSEAELFRLGKLIRRLHDAAETFSSPSDAGWNVAIPPDRQDILCHHDLAPWNLVRAGERWVFIDWDGAGPGSRLWDLAYAIRAFLPLEAGGNPQDDSRRLCAVAEGYGLGTVDKCHLAELLAPRALAMADLLRAGARTGTQPWARLDTEGHTAYWQAAHDYIAENSAVWHGALGC